MSDQQESSGPTGPIDASGPTDTLESTGSTGPTDTSGPTGPTDTLESTGSTGPTYTLESTGVSGPQLIISSIENQITGPPPIRLDDILNSVQVIQHKETEDKNLLESVGTLPYEYLKSSLIQWATSGFRNAYPIYELRIDPPSVCSDGQTRNLQDYIQFVSGKTIYEHVDALQARFPDIVVSFSYTGASILIVVTKA